MSELWNNIEKVINEQIADGYPSTQRFSTIPASLKSEGGKAFKTPEGVLMASSIKREYVSYTLMEVFNLLAKSGLVDVESAQPMGSTLHLSKPMLGDLDVLIKPSRPFDLATFKNALYDFFFLEGMQVRDLAEKGRDYLFDEFSFLFPIIDDTKQVTGQQVQVDLLLAENDETYNWRYVWYSSPAQSAWKGAARNVLLGVISSKRGFSWTKNGLFRKQNVPGIEYEESALQAIIPEEAVRVVFGDNSNISIIDSVETMMEALNTQSVLIPLKETIIAKFNSIVAAYEAEGREMKNAIQGVCNGQK